MLQIDQLLQNRYRISRVLGQGGMGAVYQAQDLSLDVICVVKEMLPPPDPALVKNMAAQFHREGKILASLRHMSLPRVSNYFVENENYYLVMDMIEGNSLEKLIGENGLFEPVVLAYADQLLDVLTYIHAKGILHRDIKPANIIVQPDGRAVLVDFGLVKVLNSGGPATKTLVSALTPQYAPPEQYTGNTDQRSDLYSLAATLYQALAGRPPASATDQMAGIHLQPLRQLPHLQQTISENTEHVLMKGLAMDRNLRYQNAASMRAELVGGGARASQPTAPPADTAGKTQVWSPETAPELLPSTQLMPDAPAQPAAGVEQPVTAAPRPNDSVSTPVTPRQPTEAESRSTSGVMAISTPVATPAGTPPEVPPAANTTGAPAVPKKPASKGLLIGGIIAGLLIIACCALVGVPAVSGVLKGLALVGTSVPKQSVTPIPLDSTNTPGVEVTSETTPTEESTPLPEATPEPEGTPLPEPTAEPVLTDTPLPPSDIATVAAEIQATINADINAVATNVAGTPQANDERYLVIAPGIEIDLARVPAGEFLMGSADSDKDAARDEKPQHSVKLDDYWISVDDITVEEFGVFVKETGYKTTSEKTGSGLVFNSSSVLVQVKGADWRSPGGPIGNLPNDFEYPVVQVSWDDANAFCQWASKVSGRKVKLPSEAEWEKAARGTDGRLYPWGNANPDANHLNYNDNVGQVESVGSYSPDGDSPFGLTDMAGNVWQWTSSLSLPYPYVHNDGREDAASRENRVVRGGAFRSGFIPSAKNSVRSAARGVADPTYHNGFLSFRVVVEP